MKSLTYNDIEIPKLGFGTFKLTEADGKSAVKTALDVGFRHIDTAQAYGNEAEVGAAIAESDIAREDIFLTTKVWFENMTADRLADSVDESLSKLKTDYADLILVHWPNKDVDFNETLTALKKVQESGKTRLIGVSNYTLEQVKTVREDLGFDIAVNQCEYHPFLDQSPLIEQAREYGMGFTAYCPIAQGKVMQDDTLKQIAQSHGKTPIQITLRWLYQQENVIAIPRSSNPDHIAGNFDIFDFELSPDEMTQVFDLTKRKNRLIDPDFAPEWDVAA